MLTLPGFEMAFSMGSKSVGQTVPPWHFTVSPLRELAVRKDAGGEYMRPDAQAEAINADSTVTGFALSLSIALLSAARLASLYGFWPFFRRRNIFKQALRKLDALSADDMDQVLTTMHQALNSLNGQPVFKHRLDIFYRKYPNYRQLGRELNWFFEYSSRYFFIGTENSGNVNLEKIKKLCQNCREIERGSR
jgi:mxaA protein